MERDGTAPHPAVDEHLVAFARRLHDESVGPVDDLRVDRLARWDPVLGVEGRHLDAEDLAERADTNPALFVRLVHDANLVVVGAEGARERADGEACRGHHARDAFEEGTATHGRTSPQSEKSVRTSSRRPGERSRTKTVPLRGVL
ncbi:hypothetical protein [Halospeciosus flavus]|uniref:hypothetical protein n=1 Tax=Halospeciosus flavus TaxID=3032283 RepID=UPI0036D269CF